MPKTNPTESPERGTINVQDMLDSLYYLNPANSLVQRAFDVVGALHRWTLENNVLAVDASIGMSANHIIIQIGETTVWDSEADSEEMLTPTACIAVYRSYVSNLFEPFRENPENN